MASWREIKKDGNSRYESCLRYYIQVLYDGHPVVAVVVPAVDYMADISGGA